MKQGSAPSSCEAFDRGEVEDYTINITAGTTSTILIPEGISLEVYPNPASDVLNIHIPGNSDELNIQVFNSTGSLVEMYTQSRPYAQLDVSSYPSGMYFIRVNSAIKAELGKFIIR